MRPRLIELCFQTAGAWELGTSGRLELPARLDRVSVLRAPRRDDGRLVAVVTRPAGGEGFDALVVDSRGRVHVRLEGYRAVALPGGPSPELLVPFRAAVEPGS